MGPERPVAIKVPVHEKATYANPRRESEGMDCVFVAGQPAILHGLWTGEKHGSVLRAGSV